MDGWMDLSNRNRFIFASNASCGRTIFPNWIVKGFSGSFQRGNSINQMSVCVLRLNIAANAMYSEPLAISALMVRRMRLGKVRWRAEIAGRWPSREEAIRCDSAIRSCCTAICQPSSCQHSTMEATKIQFIFMAFHSWLRIHHHTLATTWQLYSGPSVLPAVCCRSKKSV